MSVDDLFGDFLKGRKTFATLSEGLAETARGSSSGLADVEAALTGLVNAGRLPSDLAQILRVSLPRPAPDDVSDPGVTPAWLDAPTEIKPAIAGSAPGRAVRGGMPVPAPQATPPTPVASTVKAEVDELILSALTGGFKAYRRGGAIPERTRPGPEDRLLDSALESFRGVRLRRDAAKASGGEGRVRITEENAGAPARPVGIGTILKDRFVLDREIGRGGMGVVYRAVDRRRLEAGHEQPYVAVKLLSGDVRRSPEAFRALESEARRVQSLAHPNIVTIFDFDRDGASVFIVMELLQGRPLDAVLAETGARGLGFETSRELVDEISSGLAFAHSRGIIHCDLKPANVFVLDSGTVKILDFGLAIASRGGTFEPALLDGYTLAYASPEMLQGADCHPSDDVYALGCLVYLMVTGHRPFGTRSALEAREAGVKLERPSTMPGPAWAGLRTALNLSREGRHPDAASFRSAYFAKGWRGLFRR